MIADRDGENSGHMVCVFLTPYPASFRVLTGLNSTGPPALPPVVVHNSGQGAIFVLATAMTILLSSAAPLPPTQCTAIPVW